MNNIIEDMYYGNVEMQESKTHITPILSRKFKDLLSKEEKLSRTISDESKKLLAEYMDLLSHITEALSNKERCEKLWKVNMMRKRKDSD